MNLDHLGFFQVLIKYQINDFFGQLWTHISAAAIMGGWKMESWKFACYVFMPIFSMSFFHSAYFYEHWIIPYRRKLQEYDERQEELMKRKSLLAQGRIEELFGKS